MGQILPCNCIENAFEDKNLKAVNERIEMLQKGAKFSKKALFGLASQSLTLQLTQDTSTFKWTSVNSWSQEEKGEIDLTSQIKTVKLSGENGLQFIGIDGSIILELSAENASLRDQWALSINELLQSWIEKPDTKPSSTISAAGATNKSDYFKQRESEILAREKANNEKKSKYLAGGMKYTAQAMANR
jgi:hypothetical protein